MLKKFICSHRIIPQNVEYYSNFFYYLSLATFDYVFFVLSNISICLDSIHVFYAWSIVEVRYQINVFSFYTNFLWYLDRGPLSKLVGADKAVDQFQGLKASSNLGPVPPVGNSPLNIMAFLFELFSEFFGYHCRQGSNVWIRPTTAHSAWRCSTFLTPSWQCRCWWRRAIGSSQAGSGRSRSGTHSVSSPPKYLASLTLHSV